MARKRKYNLHNCRDCEEGFLLKSAATKGRQKSLFCPLCGENLFMEKERSLWLPNELQANRPYTPEEDEIIKTGLGNNYTFEAIADALDGRTEKSVKRRAQRLNTGRRRPWTAEENARILEAKRKGLTHDQICMLFDGKRTKYATLKQCTVLRKAVH